MHVLRMPVHRVGCSFAGRPLQSQAQWGAGRGSMIAVIGHVLLRNGGQQTKGTPWWSPIEAAILVMSVLVMCLVTHRPGGAKRFPGYI